MAKTPDDMPVESTRQRLDIMLVGRGLAASRDRARDLIIGGAVTVDGKQVQKPAKLCANSSVIEIKPGGNPWVSRAGLKLAGVIAGFQELDFTGCKALDIGASTGGFTEVLLAHGAAHVVAIDVGQGDATLIINGFDAFLVDSLKNRKCRYKCHSLF